MDPAGYGRVDRIQRLAEIKNNALDFAQDVLLDFELPDAPTVSIGNLRGFEKFKPMKEVTGYIMVHASLTSLSSRIVRMSLPIPVYRGEFLRPSVIIVDSKKIPLSQSAMNQLIGKTETKRPELIEHPYKEMEFQHLDTIQKGLFSAPDVSPDVDWAQEALIRWDGQG
jgi:hypothetical protein